MACSRAIIVDGGLRCDAEVPTYPSALCGPGMAEGSEPILGGDEFDTRRLCAHPVAQRGEDGGWRRMPNEMLRELEQPVPINSASIEELQSLTGVGPKLAERIVATRPFAAPEDLLTVKGIGEKTLDRIRHRIVVDGRPQAEAAK